MLKCWQPWCTHVFKDIVSQIRTFRVCYCSRVGQAAICNTILVLIRFPAPLLLIQFSVNELKKAAEDGSSAWNPATCLGVVVEAPGCGLTHPWTLWPSGEWDSRWKFVLVFPFTSVFSNSLLNIYFRKLTVFDEKQKLTIKLLILITNERSRINNSPNYASIFKRLTTESHKICPCCSCRKCS